MSEQSKYLLGEDRIPRAWYNIVADLPSPPPPVSASWNRPTRWAGGSRAPLSDGAYRPGGEHGTAA